MKTIKEGDIAPDFTLASSSGRDVSLSDITATQNVILYFYPKDMTPGCTIQAQTFRDLKGKFAALETVIIGVSRDSIDCHKKFIDKEKLSFELLSDEEEKVCKKYGVLTDSGSIVRTTFFIERGGVIRKIWQNVKVPGHGQEVLEAVKSLSS